MFCTRLYNELHFLKYMFCLLFLLLFPFSYLLLFVMQWKFAFLSLGRPDYLQDFEVISNRFQVCLVLLITQLCFSVFFVSASYFS